MLTIAFSVRNDERGEIIPVTQSNVAMQATVGFIVIFFVAIGITVSGFS
jgi:hypothetical protein